jgi:hypothetical protein
MSIQTLELPPLFFNNWATQTQQTLSPPALSGPTHQQVKTTSFQEVVHAVKNLQRWPQRNALLNLFHRNHRWWKMTMIIRKD